MLASRRATLRLVGGSCLGLLALACGDSSRSQAPSAVTGPLVASPPVASPSPSAGPALSSRAFAVMLDNSPEARPQSGVDVADVVYEAPAEAGIPRLMALYLRDQQAERIRPVRSARHYFVDLAAEYHVALVHIGASPQGFQALQETGLPRLDEAQGDAVFTRDPSRQAPHNAYVSTASVRGELQRRGTRVETTMAGLAFGAFQPGGQAATRVQLTYPLSGFSARYDYDAGSHTYQRSQDGQPHADGASQRRYAPHAVIVQQVQVTPIPNDDAGRVDIALVDSGSGLLLAEGTQVPLQWSQANTRDPTRFARRDGAPFVLPTGQVWAELVPIDGQLAVS